MKVYDPSYLVLQFRMGREEVWLHTVWTLQACQIASQKTFLGSECRFYRRYHRDCNLALAASAVPDMFAPNSRAEQLKRHSQRVPSR